MEKTKERQLKAELAAQGERPFVGAFREALLGLARRPGVEGVYAIIAEVDPGDGCWPFTDTIVVVGTIAAQELQAALEGLQPDEVGPASGFDLPAAIVEKHKAPMLVAWWD